MLTLEDLTLGYDLHPAVHHLSMTVEEGSLVAVVGPNGAGKSTLLKGIVGMLNPLDGSIRLEGISQSDIAYLPQHNQVDRSFPITVQEMVSLGAWQQTGAYGRLSGTQQTRVTSALARLGLQGFEKRLIGTLSGGQMQRVLFARLLLQQAKLILLDEPFTALDSRTTEDLLHLINAWHREGKTILAVLHDFEQVKKNFPQTLLLSRQAIAYGKTEDVMTEANLLRARQMNEAFDEHADFCAHGHTHHHEHGQSA